MDDVAELLDALLARCAARGAPVAGDGFVLTCVPEPGAAAGPGPRWELLVTRDGAVVGEAVAADPAGVLRAVLDPVPPALDGTGDPRPVGAPGGAVGVGALLRALEAIAVAVPLVLDVDAAGDLAPGAGGAGWAWTVTATRWDVLVEGSALRWDGASVQEALARALADLDDGPTPPAGPPAPPGGPLSR